MVDARYCFVPRWEIQWLAENYYCAPPVVEGVFLLWRCAAAGAGGSTAIVSEAPLSRSSILLLPYNSYSKTTYPMGWISEPRFLGDVIAHTTKTVRVWKHLHEMFHRQTHSSAFIDCLIVCAFLPHCRKNRLRNSFEGCGVLSCVLYGSTWPQQSNQWLNSPLIPHYGWSTLCTRQRNYCSTNQWLIGSDRLRVRARVRDRCTRIVHSSDRQP